MNNLTDGNLALTGYNDIFKSTIKSLAISSGESIVEIPLLDLHPQEFHPFNVKDDAEMNRLVKSIQNQGIITPGLIRPRVDGGYEIVCGNRRKRACELAGIPTMPVIIREMDDHIAAIVMVDSNLESREKLLPSEKAWAYKIKMEALNHNGVKGDMHSVDVLVEQTGESKNQIFRLIRLTELVITLLDRVDLNKLSFTAAVELSYLTQIEQTADAAAMDMHEVKPSLSQAVRLKKLNQSGELTIELIDKILSEAKKPPISEPKGAMRFRKYFPPDYSAKQMETVIIELLTNWKGGVII